LIENPWDGFIYSSLFKKYMKKVFYRDMEFLVHDSVYGPRDDSFLIADQIYKLDLSGKDVLDLGTGSGILAIIAAKRGAEKVIATDVNSSALADARMNARIHGVEEMIEFRNSDLFSDVNENFDLIISNPPYLPVEKGEVLDDLAKAWDGGQDGRVFIDQFLAEFKSHLTPGGSYIIVHSSLADNKKTLKILDELGLTANIISNKRIQFEELVVIEGTLKRSRE
jgi:release factor glutamine methyltransferase